MLAHLTNTSYSIVRYELVPFIAACINAIVLEKALINEVYTLYALLLISCSLHAHFIINVIDDMTHILGIRCFDITEQLNGLKKVTETHTIQYVNGRKANGFIEHGDHLHHKTT